VSIVDRTVGNDGTSFGSLLNPLTSNHSLSGNVVGAVPGVGVSCCISVVELYCAYVTLPQHSI